MNKKRTLPFSTTPKGYPEVEVGTPESGIVKIKKYGDLSPLEDEFIADAMEKIPSIDKLFIDLAGKIAEQTGKNLQEIYDDFSNNNIIEYPADIVQTFLGLIQTQKRYTQKRTTFEALAMIKFRLPECEAFEEEDLASLAPELINAIAEFCRNEKAHWVKPAEDNSVAKTPKAVAKVEEAAEKPKAAKG